MTSLVFCLILTLSICSSVSTAQDGASTRETQLLPTSSPLVFQSSTTSIKPPLTKSLTLECILNVTSSSQPNVALVGRDVSTQTSSSDVQFVTSLVVTRNNGLHVASITPHSTATAVVNTPTLEVTGNISGLAGSDQYGYLKLKWANPSEAESGTYKCEANAISSQGHNLVFASDVKVAVTMPTMSDLITVVQGIQADNNNMAGKINALQSDKQKLENSVHSLQADNNNMAADNKNMAAKINALEQKLVNATQDLNAKDRELSLALNNIRHVEHGTITCGESPTLRPHSNNWPETNANYWKAINHDRVFQRAYDNPPIVYLSLHQRDYSAAGTSLASSHPAFDISVLTVNTKGFTARCSAQVSVSQYLVINWISIPAS